MKHSVRGGRGRGRQVNICYFTSWRKLRMCVLRGGGVGGEGTTINFCWVYGACVLEPLPHYC